MFVKDMARLFHHADPSMPKSKKVSHLMRGVKEQLYAGLVRNPQTTVDEFTKGATGMGAPGMPPELQLPGHLCACRWCSICRDR